MPFLAIDPSEAEAAPTTSIGAPKTSEGETLASMVSELEAIVGERDDVDTIQIKKWINRSYLDLWTSIKHEYSRASLDLTLVGEQPFYTLPEVVRSIIGVSLILPSTESYFLGRPLDKIDLGGWRELEPDDDDPRKFFRYGEVLVLYPTPDAARTLAMDFWTRPVELTQDTHSPALGAEWHEVIFLGARKRAHSYLKEFAIAAAVEQERITLIRSRIDTSAEEDDTRVVRSSVPSRERYVDNRVRPKRTYGI